MKIKHISYKGIEFDTYDVYGYEGEGIYGLNYNGPIEDVESFRFCVCADCVKKYDLFQKCAISPEYLEEEPSLYTSDITCDVAGCNNKECADFYAGANDIKRGDLEVLLDTGKHVICDEDGLLTEANA